MLNGHGGHKQDHAGDGREARGCRCHHSCFPCCRASGNRSPALLRLDVAGHGDRAPGPLGELGREQRGRGGKRQSLWVSWPGQVRSWGACGVPGCRALGCGDSCSVLLLRTTRSPISSAFSASRPGSRSSRWASSCTRVPTCGTAGMSWTLWWSSQGGCRAQGALCVGGADGGVPAGGPDCAVALQGRCWWDGRPFSPGSAWAVVFAEGPWCCLVLGRGSCAELLVLRAPGLVAWGGGGAWAPTLPLSTRDLGAPLCAESPA